MVGNLSGNWGSSGFLEEGNTIFGFDLRRGENDGSWGKGIWAEGV